MNAASCFHKSSHLLELDLCEEINHCPICQSMNRTDVAILQEDPVITLKQCQNCFAVSASRLPTQEALESYYYSYYQSNEKKITFDDPNRFVNHLFNTTYKHLLKKEELSILDYGGGIGTISIELGKRFRDFGISKVRITVVDYSLFSYNNESLDLEVKNYSTLSEVKDQEFDLIIASAILEHLPKPNVEITCLFDLLSEGGIIYFRTPYVVPILLLFNKLSINFDFTYPGHIHDLGQAFWDSILKTFSLEKKLLILHSRPSIIETSFSIHFGRTLIAHLCKTPWHVVGNRWRYVGGWEVFIQKANLILNN